MKNCASSWLLTGIYKTIFLLLFYLASDLVVWWSVPRMWIQSLFRGHILGTFLCLRNSYQLSWIFIVDRQNGWVNYGLGKEHMKHAEANFNPRTVFVSRHGSLNIMPCILWQINCKNYGIIRTHKTDVKRRLIYERRISETQKYNTDTARISVFSFWICFLPLLSVKICAERICVQVKYVWNITLYFLCPDHGISAHISRFFSQEVLPQKHW